MARATGMRTSPYLNRAALAAIALLTAATLAGCGPVLDPAGDIARQQRNLIYMSTGLMLLIIVPVMVLTVVFAIRYRKGGPGRYDPKFDHSTGLELVIWSAPLLIIIALGALTWASTHLLDPFRPISQITRGQPVAKDVRPLRVQVVALDWKWLFIYPELGIATVNELALPVNRPVRFDLTSTDMMNTFYAPTLAGMVYAMPGMRSTLHAVLNRPGRYEGMSANYSGAGFSDMRFRLLGLDQAGFDRWVARARASDRGTLQAANFLRLAEPSEKVAPIAFAGVQPDLFRRVVERCVRPGQPCMSQLMRHDRGHGGHGVVPPGRDSQSIDGRKFEGALFKDNSEKDTGPSHTKPTQPGNRTNVDPDDQSFLLDVPGSPATARG